MTKISSLIHVFSVRFNDNSEVSTFWATLYGAPTAAIDPEIPAIPNTFFLNFRQNNFHSASYSPPPSNLSIT